MADLDDRQRRAAQALRDACVPLGQVAAAPTTLETTSPWAVTLEKLVRDLSRAVERDLAMNRALQAAAPKPGAGAEDAPWRRLEEACRRIEGDIKAGGTLRARLDEGRRSMMPRVERVVRERLTPRVQVERARLQATIDPEGLNALRTELPEWVRSWAAYGYGWVDVDLERGVREAWFPRDGDMPLPPPEIAPLESPAFQMDIQFPVLSLEREQSGIWATVARHGRSVFFGLLSMTFLFGVSRNELPGWAYVIGAVIALGYAVYQAQSERLKEREKLESDLRVRAETATWETVRHWLDRCADKLNEDARRQLFERREAFVRWYREQVVPARDLREQDAAARNAAADQARRDAMKLSERQRDVQKAKDALRALQALLPTAGTPDGMPV